MRVILTILFANIINVFVYIQIGLENESSNEILLGQNNKHIFKTSFFKFRKVSRNLEQNKESDSLSEIIGSEESNDEKSSEEESIKEELKEQESSSEEELKNKTIEERGITPPPPGINEHAAVHILSFNNYNCSRNPEKQIFILTFRTYIYYYESSPFRSLSFTLRNSYTISRDSTKTEVSNSTVKCIFDSSEISTKISLYNCESEVENEPELVESYNDFRFQKENGEEIELSFEQLDMSPEAAKSLSFIHDQKNSIKYFVFLNGEVVVKNFPSSSFYINGKLIGSQSEKISYSKKLTFTLYQTNVNGNETQINITCTIINKKIDDFKLKCALKTSFSGSLYESSAIVDDTIVILNLTQGHDIYNFKGKSDDFVGTPTIPLPIESNHISAIHILRINDFSTSRHPGSSIFIFTFRIYIYYNKKSPFKSFSFILRSTYSILRRLQEFEFEDSSTVCLFDFLDRTTNIASYNCEAEVEKEPENIQSFYDFKFETEDGKIVEIDSSDLGMSPSAVWSFESLNFQSSNAQNIIFLNGEIINEDNSSFNIKGKLVGNESEKILDYDKLTFTLYQESLNGKKTPVETTCIIINKEIDDLNLKCEPESSFSGSLYESTATVDNTIICLNLTHGHDTINIVKTDKNKDNKNNNNLYYRKQSNGITKVVVIIGIIIACSIVIIITILLAIYLRRKKALSTNNNKTIDTLKTLDNNLPSKDSSKN